MKATPDDTPGVIVANMNRKKESEEKDNKRNYSRKDNHKTQDIKLNLQFTRRKKK